MDGVIVLLIYLLVASFHLQSNVYAYSPGEEYPGILTSISVTAYEAVLHSKCKD